jgi:hypothetical protein
MVIQVLADEQNHLREFEGYLKEYDVRQPASTV